MTWLHEESSAIEHLLGVVIAQIPDCIPWESWQKSPFDAGELAAYFGDMVKAQRHACQSLTHGQSDIRFSIESEELTILVSELSINYVAVFIFSEKVSLGLARYSVKRLSSRILVNLPNDEVVVRSYALRVVEFIKRYAPDPHSVMMRISLQTKIPFDKINNPDSLSAEELEKLELSAKSILGISDIRV